MSLEVIEHKADNKTKETPILLVHGTWHGAWCWKDTFMPFFASQGYDVYALSLRGHGESVSEKSIKVARIAEYVSDLETAISTLPSPPLLIGHSTGAMVAQKYLETHDTPGAVLLASVPVHGVWKSILKRIWYHPISFLSPIAGNPKLVREQFFTSAVSQDFVDAWAAKLCDESYMAFLDLLILNRVNSKLLRGKKLLVVGGGADKFYSAAEYKKTAKAYDAPVFIFPDLSHHLMVGPGWEEVADRIAEWFTELSQT